MLSNFWIRIEWFISEYDYAQDQDCSGRRIGTETSLQSALAKCDTNDECACIYDSACDGYHWYMHADAGQSNTFNHDCSWTKKGTLI